MLGLATLSMFSVRGTVKSPSGCFCFGDDLNYPGPLASGNNAEISPVPMQKFKVNELQPLSDDTHRGLGLKSSICMYIRTYRGLLAFSFGEQISPSSLNSYLLGSGIKDV